MNARCIFACRPSSVRFGLQRQRGFRAETHDRRLQGEAKTTMADLKNEYCMHTATCGELRKEDVGREVTLTGWAWHNRDHGGLIFCDLRDRMGYTQVVVDPDCVSAEDFAKAEHLGREYVLKVTGTVRERAAEAVNPNMVTGEIEVLASALEVLNTSVTPPFSIEDGIETDETTRMKWRYLDIRRPEMYQALFLRHTVAQAMRRALNERGFLEIETPILANSTPEGARDYIVPSRPNRVSSTRCRKAPSSSSRCSCARAWSATIKLRAASATRICAPTVSPSSRR